MVHDDRTYLDDEGLEYVAWSSRQEEEAEELSSAEERLWGTRESYGGYDAE